MINKPRLIITALLAAMMATAFGQGSSMQDFHIRRLTTRDGLTSNYIRSMVQDNKGYLWLGTLYGLCRYDGYRFVPFTHSNSGNDSLLLENRILNLSLNPRNGLMIIRLRGNFISCYDTGREVFLKILPNGKLQYKHLWFAPNGDTWLFTSPKDSHCRLVYRNGALSTYLFRNETEARKSGFAPKDDRTDIGVKGTTYKDNRGRLFVADDYGNLYYRNGKGRLLRWQLLTKEEREKDVTFPFNIVSTAKGTAWVASRHGRLFQLNLNTGEQMHDSALQQQSIQGKNLAVMIDKADNIWLSQEYAGLVQLSGMPESIREYATISDAPLQDQPTLRLLPRVQGDIIAVCQQDPRWTGTRKRGLFFDGQHYTAVPKNRQGLHSNKITAIFKDNKSRIWIGATDRGFYQALPQQDGSYKFRLVPEVGMENVNTVCQLSDGSIAVGCMEVGLIVFDPERKNSARQYKTEFDGNGNIDVRCIMEDKEHRLWVSTIGAGLFRSTGSDFRNLTFKSMRDQENFSPAFNSVESIISDRQGNVWIGTDDGIISYGINSQRFNRFLLSPEMLGNVFLEQSAVQMPSGELAFGTRGGIIVFDPAAVLRSTVTPSVTITNILVNGQPIRKLDGNTFSGSSKEITLGAEQNTLTFHFSDFKYDEVLLTEYSYMLEGHDSHWSPPSHDAQAVFQNLKPGNYRLLVRAYSGNTNEQCPVTALDICIKPHWWAAWWAYIIYIVAAGAASLYFYRHAKTLYRLRQRITLERRMTEFKSQFFINVSHEFRTPLTLIRGAMDRLAAVEDTPAAAKAPLSAMKRSVQRLMRLNGELMEYHRMENDKLHLRLQEVDIVALLRDIADNFRIAAESKELGFQFIPSANSLKVAVDADKIDKIVFNLLSNAFKYTPRHGSVMMTLRCKDDNLLEIRVADTGIGIARDQQEKLFERFSQGNVAADSMGIGLNLTWGLVNAHKGTMHYEDNPGGGSVFVVTLPTDRSAYEEGDFVVGGEAVCQHKQGSEVPYTEMPAQPMNDIKVLVVEDDDDVRDFIKQELSRLFTVQTAINGKEALDMIAAEVPSLVLTDIRMPIMDGLTLLKKIRADGNLFDLPVIMLTAFSSEEKQLKGLEYGADAYIHKPFSAKMLCATCVNLINRHQKVMEQLTKKQHLQAAMQSSEAAKDADTPQTAETANAKESATVVILTSESDKKFILQLDRLVSERIADANLSVDDLAAMFKMGRSKFYEKVKATTGKTPNNYIRDYRMEAACQLLEDETLTVAEVAYKVGFSDPFYFGTCFKRQYGITPSKYQKGERPVAQ